MWSKVTRQCVQKGLCTSSLIHNTCSDESHFKCFIKYAGQKSQDTVHKKDYVHPALFNACSDESHFNVSLNMRGKLTRHCPYIIYIKTIWDWSPGQPPWLTQLLRSLHHLFQVLATIQLLPLSQLLTRNENWCGESNRRRPFNSLTKLLTARPNRLTRTDKDWLPPQRPVLGNSGSRVTYWQTDARFPRATTPRQTTPAVHGSVVTTFPPDFLCQHFNQAKDMHNQCI